MRSAARRFLGKHAARSAHEIISSPNPKTWSGWLLLHLPLERSGLASKAVAVMFKTSLYYKLVRESGVRAKVARPIPNKAKTTIHAMQNAAQMLDNANIGRGQYRASRTRLCALPVAIVSWISRSMEHVKSYRPNSSNGCNQTTGDEHLPRSPRALEEHATQRARSYAVCSVVLAP